MWAQESLEELLHVQGQEGWQLRVPGCDSAGAAERCYPRSEVRGGGREELPDTRGQGRWPGEVTQLPRSSGCTGTGKPRAIPRSGSEGVAVRRYPLSKVRSSGYTLLEQP